jgi:multidrug efflux pump subunit AcrA (membrane-fusion protein)
MKNRQIIILLSILVVLGLIYVPILFKGKTEDGKKVESSSNYVPVFLAQNKIHNQTVSAYGQIVGNAQLNVSMQVQGEVDRDNRTLKPGTHFKKNEILIKVDRVEALYNLLSRRSAFINLISGILPDIYMDFPDEKEKWDNYLSKISATSALPELPRFNSQKEKLLVSGRNIPSEYYSIKSAETQIEKYFYVAPFNGVIIESMTEPGSMVSPGVQLMTIAKTGDYEVKAPIDIRDLALFKKTDKIHFVDAKKDTVGYGILRRVGKTINQQTQSVDAYFSIKPQNNSEIIIGSFVNLTIETPLFERSIVVPENAVYDNTVQILKDSLIYKKTIKTIGTKPDSIFIKGIEDNTQLVLEPLKSPNDSTKFIGITK